MREVYLEYNPYKVETKIFVDGEKPKRNSRFNTENRRLQEWIEEMPEILKEEYRDKNFKITFHLQYYSPILSYSQVSYLPLL